MYNLGYGYANLAKGVVECSLEAGGATALQYVTDVAKQNGINLTTTQVAKIEIDMAYGYANTLIKIAGEGGGVVNREITGDEALTLHNIGFDNNGLPRESWTLYLPSKYLTKDQFNANFAASIALGTNIWDSGKWGLDMFFAGQKVMANLDIGIPSSGTVKSLVEINGWIARVVDGTGSAAANTLGVGGTIAGCQASVQGVILQLQKDAAAKQIQDPIIPPAALGTPARDSASFFTSSDSNSVVVKSGGTLSDIWWTQRNAANGFASDKEFYASVMACNPAITDVNRIQAGQTIYLPTKLSNGSITYNYANGASVTTNAATGEYTLLNPNADGGKDVFLRVANADAGYTIRIFSTNRSGDVTSDWSGHQAELSSEIIPLSMTTEISTGLWQKQTDTNGDGTFDSSSLISNTAISLQDIAATEGISLADLLAANPGLSTQMSITPGTIINLPTYSEVPPTTPAFDPNDLATWVAFIQAARSGKPLPIIKSGIDLAAAFDKTNFPLAEASGALGSLSSLYALQNSIHNNDALAPSTPASSSSSTAPGSLPPPIT